MRRLAFAVETDDASHARECAAAAAETAEAGDRFEGDNETLRALAAALPARGLGAEWSGSEALRVVTLRALMQRNATNLRRF